MKPFTTVPVSYSLSYTLLANVCLYRTDSWCYKITPLLGTLIGCCIDNMEFVTSQNADTLLIIFNGCLKKYLFKEVVKKLKSIVTCIPPLIFFRNVINSQHGFNCSYTMTTLLLIHFVHSDKFLELMKVKFKLLCTAFCH